MADPRAAQFLKIATTNNLLAKHQADQILKDLEAQKSTGGTRTAGEVAVEKGFITAQQAQTVESILRTVLPPEQVGGYRVGAKIGRGAVGTVYRGTQVSLEKEVAIKILHQSLSNQPRFVQRFIQEARAAGRLNHPNIVQAIDAGVDGDYNYLVMELVDGESLGAKLKREGSIPEARALEIAASVARGLGHAHQNQLLHRDMKPDNVLIGKGGQIKVADMGLAIPIEDAELLLEEHRRMGTPFYLSPEQAKGEEIDARSDLYSLGATLYHMLAGAPPFSGTTVKEILARQVQQAPTPLREVKPEISAAAEAIVMKLLAKERQGRFPNAAAVAQAIEAALAAGGKARVAPLERESATRTVARDKVSAAVSSVTMAPPRGSAARPMPAAPRTQVGARPRPKPLGEGGEPKKQPSVFTIAGAVGGIILSLIFLVIAVNNNKEEPDRLAEARAKAESARGVQDSEIIAKRRKQWQTEKVEMPMKDVGSILSQCKRPEADPERSLGNLIDSLKKRPDAPNSLEMVELINSLRKKVKDLSTAKVDEGVFSKADAAWAAGQNAEAYRLLKWTDWPLELRNDESKARAMAKYAEWDALIEKRWTTDQAEVEKLRRAKSFAKALEILDAVPDYSTGGPEGIATNAEKIRMLVEDEKKVFEAQERERIAKENVDSYKALLIEITALAQIRDFKGCLQKAQALEASVQNEAVKTSLRGDIAALTELVGFMDTFTKTLEKSIGTGKTFTVKLTNDNKHIGTVDKLEPEKVFLAMKRGSGVASVPLKYSEIHDETVYQVVATEVGEKTGRYLVPVALIAAYRGQYDVAHGILTQAAGFGVDVAKWQERVSSLKMGR